MLQADCLKLLAWAASQLACCPQEGLSQPRTAELASALLDWGMVHGQQVLLIVENLTQALNLAGRNMPNLMLTTPDRLFLSEILKADKIIIEPVALKYIQVEIAMKCWFDCTLTCLTSRDILQEHPSWYSCMCS